MDPFQTKFGNAHRFDIQIPNLAAAGCSAQHSTGITNLLNTIQRLGSDDKMFLGMKSSTFLRVEHPLAQKFEVQIFLTCLQLVGTLGNLFREICPRFRVMSSTHMMNFSITRSSRTEFHFKLILSRVVAQVAP